MKKKLVLWGKQAEAGNRVLLAFELLPDDNEVMVYTFEEEVATEAFSQQMMNEWREGKPFELPEARTEQRMPLQVTGTILPDGYTVERSDLVQRAQTEWHFLVLSVKMHSAYLSDLDVLQEKVNALDSFQPPVWEELKGFWGRIQEQIRDRNLDRSHAQELRQKTNALFAQMKALRRKQDEAFKEHSKEERDRFMKELEAIEERLAQGMRLQGLFEDLKKLQRSIKKAPLTRDHRSAVWDRLDKNFKAVKAKKFGDSGDDRSPLQRLQRRYDGLIKALERMEHSIQRDERELHSENRKASQTDNQLESQIRQAKILMIEERVRSKKEKLEDMRKTRAELERRMEKEREKEARREEARKKEEMRKAAEEKIARQIKQAAEARKEEEEKLREAAESIQTAKTKRPKSKKQADDHLPASIQGVVDDVQAVLSSLPAAEEARDKTPAETETVSKDNTTQA